MITFNKDMYKRHTCVICGRKRYEYFMKSVLRNSWACKDKYHLQVCCDNEEIRIAEKIIEQISNFKFIKKNHIFN